MDDTLKTRGLIYLNVETWLLFAPPYQNCWLRACVDQRCSGNFTGTEALLGIFAYICKQQFIIH